MAEINDDFDEIEIAEVSNQFESVELAHTPEWETPPTAFCEEQNSNGPNTSTNGDTLTQNEQDTEVTELQNECSDGEQVDNEADYDDMNAETREDALALNENNTLVEPENCCSENELTHVRRQCSCDWVPVRRHAVVSQIVFLPSG